MRATLPALACAALALAGCNSHGDENAGPQPPPDEAWLTPAQMKEAKLVIAPVATQDVGGSVDTSGRITFDDLRVAHVFSPVTGRVTKILAQPGQRVHKGQMLVSIESPEMGQAVADLGKAHADLTAAEHEYKRQKDLYEQHATSQKETEKAEDDYRKAKAEMQRAQQKARLLRSDTVDHVTSEFMLRAPIDGDVIDRRVSPGQEVQGQYSGSNALELFTIGESDTVWMMADVFEKDLAQVRGGQQVVARVVAYDRLFDGKVDFVSGSLDAQSRTAKVRCSLKNLRGVESKEWMLKPEMFATVSIAVGGRRELAIPRNALLRLGDVTVVFVKKGDAPGGLTRFERRPVAVVEDEGGDYLPVRRNLIAGEEIVTSGAVLLSGMM